MYKCAKLRTAVEESRTRSHEKDQDEANFQDFSLYLKEAANQPIWLIDFI